MQSRVLSCRAFSLVEVVLALGVISFAIVAILGVFPIGLSTSRSAQDETRAPQIAQTIFASLEGQPFSAVSIKLYGADGAQSGTLDVDLALQTGANADFNGLSANNYGEIFIIKPGDPPKFLGPYFPPPPPPPLPDTTPVYAIALLFNNAPSGFDTGYANKVTLSVAWPASAPVANQTRRNYTRIISKY
jgi:type II secretory pathway pseudopilin PulG